MLDQIKNWVTDYVRAVLNSVIRVAEVDSTDPDTATVRVRLEDDDRMVSHNLRVLMRNTTQNRDYWMPDVQEQVLCLFLPFGLEQGFVLGSFYSRPDQPPVQDQNKRHIEFADGTWFEYDRNNNLWSGSVQGDVDLEVTGNAELNVGGDMTAEVTGSAKIQAGADITLTAPLVKIMGSITMQSQEGEGTTEEKNAETQHTGSYSLVGDMSITGDLHVGGDITCDGSNPNNHNH